jgi:divalent metal cation (Fe/Co/Zn/Cd) transporter
MVHVFVAVFLGPGSLLVAAKVRFGDDRSATDIERIADEAEERLRARFRGVRYVFLDPTRSHGTERGTSVGGPLDDRRPSLAKRAGRQAPPSRH